MIESFFAYFRNWYRVTEYGRFTVFNNWRVAGKNFSNANTKREDWHEGYNFTEKASETFYYNSYDVNDRYI